MTIPAITGIEVHPAANIFPMMDGESFDRLVEDIRANGQRESCTTWKGQLVDGRNRWVACQVLGIEPSVGDIDDDDFDAVAFVLSANLYRRHLNESQRGLIAARLKKVEEGPAKERQKATLKKGNEKPVPANLPERNNGESREKAGTLLNVSPRTVQHAETVIDFGSAELIAAVESGEVAVSKAAKIAKTTPKCDQVTVAKAKAPRKPKVRKPTQTYKPPTVIIDPDKPRKSKPITDTRCLNLIKLAEAALSEEDADEALHLAMDAAKAARDLCLDLTHHPTLDEVKAYCEERKNSVNPETWFAHYKSNGWMVGKNRMRDWRAAVVTWEGNEKKWTKERSDGKATGRVSSPQSSIDAWERKAARTRA